MRSLIIGMAALFALAAPGLAAANTGGSIKLTYAAIDGYDNFDDEEEFYTAQSDNVVALSGVVVTDIDPMWRVQFNATTSDTESNYFGNSYSDAHSQVEVHATYTHGMFDVGGFAGMFNNNGHSFYEYGVEAVANFERGEVGVSVAGATSPNSDFLDDITTVAATGSFNVTEQIAIGATASNTNFGSYYYSGDDIEVTSLGVNLAYQIPNCDLAVGVGYRRSEVDYGDNFGGQDEDVDFVGVSLAWSFGEGAGGRQMGGASALIPDAIAAGGSFFVS